MFKRIAVVHGDNENADIMRANPSVDFDAVLKVEPAGDLDRVRRHLALDAHQLRISAELNRLRFRSKSLNDFGDSSQLVPREIHCPYFWQLSSVRSIRGGVVIRKK